MWNRQQGPEGAGRAGTSEVVQLVEAGGRAGEVREKIVTAVGYVPDYGGFYRGGGGQGGSQEAICIIHFGL